MDVSERLMPEDLRGGDYLAASHLHRYGLARELLAGLRVLDVGCGVGYGSALMAERAASVIGVDVDEEAIGTARETYGGEDVAFEVDDALARLRRTAPSDVDAVVMFEAIEHVPDVPLVLAELRRLADAGKHLIVSMPNSLAFGERNRFHLTDFGYDRAHAAFDGFGDVRWVYQQLSEGSLLLGDGEVGASAILDGLHQAAPETANTFIALVGFDDAVSARAEARLQAVVTPAFNEYMLELEQANRDLYRANRQLARGIYGRFDAAAAVTDARVTAVRGEVEQEVSELETRAWILKEERDRFLRERDEARTERDDARATLKLRRGGRETGRHHAVDRTVSVVRRTPGLRRPARAAARTIRRLRRRQDA